MALTLCSRRSWNEVDRRFMKRSELPASQLPFRTTGAIGVRSWGVGHLRADNVRMELRLG